MADRKGPFLERRARGILVIGIAVSVLGGVVVATAASVVDPSHAGTAWTFSMQGAALAAMLVVGVVAWPLDESVKRAFGADVDARAVVRRAVTSGRRIPLDERERLLAERYAVRVIPSLRVRIVFTALLFVMLAAGAVRVAFDEGGVSVLGVVMCAVIVGVCGHVIVRDLGRLRHAGRFLRASAAAAALV